MDLFSAYTEILREELKPAMGCTEPIAIAYASSILRHAMGKVPSSARILLSGNIIKNVKSVIVPATGGMHGIEAAVAAGIVAGCPDRKLEVLCARAGIRVRCLSDYYEGTVPDWARSCLVINYSGLSEEALPAVLERLAGMVTQS